MGQDRETLHRDALCVRDALIRASRVLPDDTEAAIASAAARGGKAESVMAAIRTNLQIAREKGMPMCQDTGAFWCLASIGRSADVRIGDVEKVIQEGAALAAEEGIDNYNRAATAGIEASRQKRCASVSSSRKKRCG